MKTLAFYRRRADIPQPVPDGSRIAESFHDIEDLAAGKLTTLYVSQGWCTGWRHSALHADTCQVVMLGEGWDPDQEAQARGRVRAQSTPRPPAV